MVQTPARPIFFPRIDDSHCDRIYSSLNTVRCFDNGYVGKHQWLGKNIVRSTVQKNSRKAWIGALAAAI